MIITVANRKGGVGKTTTAVFVAHALAESTGAACTLVDADPQASAAQWSRLAAAAGHPLEVAVRKHGAGRLELSPSSAAHVVIDTPPDDSDVVAAAIELADIVLVPMSPSALDLSVVPSTLDLAASVGTPAAVLLTRTRRTRSVATAEQTLRESGAQLLRTHIALRETLAMAFGRPVRQLYGYELALAELLGALPEQPYSVDAVRQRASRPVPHRAADIRPHVVLPTSQRAGKHAADLHPAGLGFDDDLMQRLKKSVARLAQ